MAFVHGARTRLWLNDQHVSGFVSSFQTSCNRNLAETTNLLAGGTTSIPGLQEGGMTLNGFVCTQLTPPAQNITDLLQAAAHVAGGHGVIGTAVPGTPAVAYPAFLTRGDPTKYEIETKVDDAVQFNFEVQGENGAGDWGQLLNDGTTAITATANGTTVDNGVTLGATLNGGVANLHVTAITGTTPTATFKVQHSTDNITFVDLVTFTGLTTVTGSQHVLVPAGTTVNRYVRAQYTLGGTTPNYTALLAFARR